MAAVSCCPLSLIPSPFSLSPSLFLLCSLSALFFALFLAPFEKEKDKEKPGESQRESPERPMK
jgi:hypothetical protein